LGAAGAGANGAPDQDEASRRRRRRAALHEAADEEDPEPNGIDIR
jgi:hypothetical protein